MKNVFLLTLWVGKLFDWWATLGPKMLLRSWSSNKINWSVYKLCRNLNTFV